MTRERLPQFRGGVSDCIPADQSLACKTFGASPRKLQIAGTQYSVVGQGSDRPRVSQGYRSWGHNWVQGLYLCADQGWLMDGRFYAMIRA